MTEAFLYYIDKSKVSALQVELLERKLSVAERRKLKKMQNINTRKDFSLSRLLLKRLLSYYSFIGKTIYGKPYLVPNANDIKISISHTENILCILLGTDIFSLGVDIEMCDRKVNKTQIFEFLYSEQEKSKMSKKELHDNFFAYWTYKEAFTKAIGRGMFVDFNQISMCDKYKNYNVIAQPIAIDDNHCGFAVFLDKKERVVKININKVCLFEDRI